MVYYRKYRPQTLDDLIGQSQVKQILSQSVISGNLGHAYLFCGPRGTGKTSTARILAKMVNCENQSSVVSHQSSEKSEDRKLKTDSLPCNKCDSCISITDGSNLDLIEIDAASNRGIDDIRSLRENIKLSPTKSKKKIYIIDEVHMLTTEAFNALLKTLEEPPEHVLFILATTESHKIPATILSRVQKLDFQLASVRDLVIGLEKIAKSEKLDFDKEALELIAKRGEGSFRDSQKLLNQIASNGEKLTVDLVESSTKAGSFDDGINLLNQIADKNAKGAIEIIQSQVEAGINIKEFTSSVIDLLRQMMLFQAGVLEGGTVRLEQVKKLSQRFDSDKLIKTLNIFIESIEKQKYVSIPSLPLEIAVVEATVQIKSEVVSVIPVETGIQIVEDARILTRESTGLSPVQDDKIETLQDNIVPIVIDDHNAINQVEKDSEDKNKVLDKWNYILETIRPYNFSLEALLKQARVLNVESGAVTLEVPYSFHQRILDAPKSKDLLESVLADILGKHTRVFCVLGSRPVRVEEIANIEVAADDDVIRLAAEIFNS